HEYALVAASRDWHDPDNDNGGHFAAGAPDFVDTWPVHCVAGSPGADYHPALDALAIDVHVKKGQGKPAYSAFEGVTDDDETLAEVLEEQGIDELDVVGIATDYCVKASALDGALAGLEVRVIDALTSAVSPETRQTALDEMRDGGVEVVRRH
ncbi:MAG: isochorismatase family protein, partial [Agrococcus sp.]